ncbi:MAG: peptide ABC transporter ATP-binding protein [Spirochaetaceae bacterium 4572_7]|nr:MAG: peptide ABC transporter ATP-binding protein [Spirochaetaceae bacterium 4572_7]
MDGKELLTVKNLSVEFQTGKGRIEVIDRVNFKIKAGKTLGVVGESGCGKSVTASSIMRLLPHPYGEVTSGEVFFHGEDLLTKPVEDMYKIRGGKISMIFQEPMTAMNPVQVAGKQIKEVLDLHRNELTKDLIDQEIIKILQDVEMPSPEVRVKNYPFQLSGGMRQRMMIAMALAGEPDILIADEPTTALDVTVQAQILKLIKTLQEKNNMGVLFITHDMGVVAEVSDDVVVMYAGQIVESGDVETIFLKPKHPYTKGLISSMPHLETEPKTHLPSIKGNVPTPSAYPETCRFANRCDYVTDKCRENTPTLDQVKDGHYVRCFRVGEI